MRETKKKDVNRQPFCTQKEVQVSVFGDEERFLAMIFMLPWGLPHDPHRCHAPPSQ